jgi:mannitol-1-phosphate 5-dehydrogenase
VIGKMSGVVTEAEEIREAGLARITEELPRAFLVEEFNRILITKISAPQFQRGIGVFEEKFDLLPFAEAKLYGHNAVHALLGLLASRQGLQLMSQLAEDRELLQLGREAFLQESGAALMARHGGTDVLFTAEGWRQHAEDLLERMINPWLRDTVARVIRDPRRKLGWNDRLIGTMRLALDAQISPRRFAGAAAAALKVVDAERPGSSLRDVLDSFWREPGVSAEQREAVKSLILQESRV